MTVMVTVMTVMTVMVRNEVFAAFPCPSRPWSPTPSRPRSVKRASSALIPSGIRLLAQHAPLLDFVCQRTGKHRTGGRQSERDLWRRIN